MLWLFNHYTLHALAVLVWVGWAVRIERQRRASKETMKTLVRMIDRDLEEIREERDGQMIRVAEMLVEIRAGVETLVGRKDPDYDRQDRSQ